MSATPRPWTALCNYVQRDCKGLDTLAVIANCPVRKTQPVVSMEEAKANAALIVRAVNEIDRFGGFEGLQDLERQATKYLSSKASYDAMREELEELVNALANMMTESDKAEHLRVQVNSIPAEALFMSLKDKYDKAKAALALAGKE